MDILFYLILAAVLVVLIIIGIFLIRRSIYRLVDHRIAVYQNDLVTKHCNEVENMYLQMRGWRHDYHNHIQTMKVHLAFDQIVELSEYLGKLDDDLTTVDTVIKTGNVMVDAILNSKLSLAGTKKININAKASVPETLNISEIDLCVIIGNLLDNAMEACMKSDPLDEYDPFIRVYIRPLKGQLYISVSNSVRNRIIKKGKNYISTKNSATHGFGLMRIDRIAEKYKGYVNRQNEDGVFATEVMLPL